MKHLIVFLVLLQAFFLPPSVTGAKEKTQFKIDTPLKAAVFYFPSPQVVRCLIHSGIPKDLRKAQVVKKVKLENGEEIIQSIVVGVNKGENFIFSGSISSNSGIIPFKINGQLAFGKKAEGFNFGLFGIEKLLGLQGKVSYKDKIGNQEVKYETYLKSTKGKVGNQNYVLELDGKDLVVNGMVEYLLIGSGMIGEYKLSVNGKSTEEDQYLLSEEYGPLKALTTIKVYE